jgi:hypothetical protein
MWKYGLEGEGGIVNRFLKVVLFSLSVCIVGCAHQKVSPVSAQDAARLDRKFVRESIVFEDGTRDGAVVPELSAPGLKARWQDEYIDGNVLHEAHRVWELDGEVSFIGIPKPKPRKAR